MPRTKAVTAKAVTLMIPLEILKNIDEEREEECRDRTHQVTYILRNYYRNKKNSKNIG